MRFFFDVKMCCGFEKIEERLRKRQEAELEMSSFSLEVSRNKDISRTEHVRCFGDEARLRWFRHVLRWGIEYYGIEGCQDRKWRAG